MQTLVLMFSYIRAIIHWFWIIFVTFIFTNLIILLNIIGYKQKSYQMTRLWAFLLLYPSGIKIKRKNTENIKKPFLIMFNHRSYVDILALFQTTPYNFYFGAKKILFSIPFLGFAMKVAGHIPIHRSKPKEVYKLYASLKQRIEKGDSFALSPEGERHTGPGLNRFKKGPFLLATQQEINIVPVFIHNAEKCMPKGSWFFNIGALKRTVTVEYLPDINTKKFTKNDIKKLQDQVADRFKPLIST